MVQGADGYWYAYIGSTEAVQTAHGNANVHYGDGHSINSAPQTGARSDNVATGHGFGNLTTSTTGYNIYRSRKRRREHYESI